MFCGGVKINVQFTRTFYMCGARKGLVAGVGTETTFLKRSCRITDIQHLTDSLDVAAHNFRPSSGQFSTQAVKLNG